MVTEKGGGSERVSNTKERKKIAWSENQLWSGFTSDATHRISRRAVY